MSLSHTQGHTHTYIYCLTFPLSYTYTHTHAYCPIYILGISNTVPNICIVQPLTQISIRISYPNVANVLDNVIHTFYAHKRNYMCYICMKRTTGKAINVININILILCSRPTVLLALDIAWTLLNKNKGYGKKWDPKLNMNMNNNCYKMVQKVCFCCIQ